MDQDWSPQQVEALETVGKWFADPDGPQVFRLFGYAGTGKTTLALQIARKIRRTLNEEEDGAAKGAVLFAAFTGKASLVMQSKGCRGASTIHSLIYKLDEETVGGPRFVLNEDDSKLADAKLCIIDECSMVGAELAADLLSFGVKILVLGDPAQLPPVKDAGFFTNVSPDVMLTEVHRQAAENPIIRFSMDIREGRKFQFCDHGDFKVIPRKGMDPSIVTKADQVLVGMNKTRTTYNARLRELLGFKGDLPEVGEKLVCLRNNRQKHLFNGGIWRVKKVLKSNEAAWRAVLEPEDAGDHAVDTEVKVHPLRLLGRDAEYDAIPYEDRREFDEFTFGYALTVHKSQGSQWDNVVLFDESGAFRQDRARWLYTGVTRAAKTLTVVA